MILVLYMGQLLTHGLCYHGNRLQILLMLSIHINMELVVAKLAKHQIKA
jgi:hypothetical protein